jgi:hypothetical protein
VQGSRARDDHASAPCKSACTVNALRHEVAKAATRAQADGQRVHVEARQVTRLPLAAANAYDTPNVGGPRQRVACAEGWPPARAQPYPWQSAQPLQTRGAKARALDEFPQALPRVCARGRGASAALPASTWAPSAPGRRRVRARRRRERARAPARAPTCRCAPALGKRARPPC